MHTLLVAMTMPVRAMRADDGPHEPHREVDAERDRRPPPIVYVVDDDIATLALLCDIAEDAGWDVRGFTRLADLQGSLDRLQPDLMILDDDLPDGRGGDLAREMREDPRLAGVPFVVCTAAHPMRQAEITSWAPVVSKPFDVGEIERFLHEAAGRGRGAYREAAG